MSRFWLFVFCFLLFLSHLINGKVIRDRLIGNATKEKDQSELKSLNGGKEWSAGTDGWNKIFVDSYGCQQSTDYICNLHNPKYNCTCYRPNQISSLRYPSCDEVFHVQNVRAYVVELRTKMPRNTDFMNNFDTFLGDLIEDFCAIDQKYLVILRKRCSIGDMLIQIAFLRATDSPLPDQINISDLQAVHPSIFTNNKDFMEQTYLPILNVSQVDFLTPVVRQPGEPIIHGKRYKQEKSDTLLSNLVEIGYIVFFGFILLIANLIPICLLWKIICDRRTRDSSPRPIQLNHL